MNNEPLIRNVELTVYKVPTDVPEADGTLDWESTTLVAVEISAGKLTGLGYTYGTRPLKLYPDILPQIAWLVSLHHVRIERMLFDGFIEQRNGLKPDDSRPGLDLTLKHRDALRYAA